MNKSNQKMRRDKRRPLRNRIKYHLKTNGIKQKDVAEVLGLTDQEFHNFLTGHQSSAPSKGILSFEQFKNLVISHLGIEEN